MYNIIDSLLKGNFMIPHIKDNQNNWTVIIEGSSHQFDHTHPRYNKLVKYVSKGNEQKFIEAINIGMEIQNWSNGSFEFKNGYLYFEGETVANDPTRRVIECMSQGFPHEFMLNYLSNLYDNVSSRSIEESYKWCSHKGLPITEDGMLIGYKGVAVYSGVGIKDKMNMSLIDGDLVDKYTGKSYRNNVGDKPSMKRRQVCDDHTIGCSYGLHVGTYDYACDWAGPSGEVVLVKFNPKDIVSVPSCCDWKKMRVSDYEVLSIARGQIESAVYDDEDDEDDDDYRDDYDESMCDKQQRRQWRR